MSLDAIIQLVSTRPNATNLDKSWFKLCKLLEDHFKSVERWEEHRDIILGHLRRWPKKEQFAPDKWLMQPKR
jgi:hypothetical protein